MPRPVVQVTGARELRRALTRAGDDLGDLKDANAQAAALVARAASPRAPRVTGRLAGTIRSSGTKTQALVRLGTARVPYAGPIVFGWATHHIRSNPFPIDAAYATEAGWTGLYLAQIDAIISRLERSTDSE